MEYGTAIITVTQGDWQYIQEWIEYHHSIGVDMIFIGYNGPIEQYDNLPKYDYVKYYDYATDQNDPRRQYMYLSGGEGFSGWVGQDTPEYEMRIMQQIENQLLREILYFFPHIKYVCVIDVDEFLDIHTDDNITEFLSKNLPDINSSIAVQMRFYNDNELIYNDTSKGVMERFKNPIQRMSINNDPGFGKMIINMYHPDVRKGEIRLFSPHTCTKIKWGFVLDPDKIELNHYWTKSLEEWIMKFSPIYDKDYIGRFYNNIFENFFKYNKITEEKLKAIPDLLKKYNINYNPLNEQNKEFIYKYKKTNQLTNK